VKYNAEIVKRQRWKMCQKCSNVIQAIEAPSFECSEFQFSTNYGGHDLIASMVLLDSMSRK